MKVLKYFLVFILSLLFFVTLFFLESFENVIGLMFAFMHLQTICLYVFSKKNCDFFSPMILFSLYNLFVPFSEIYLLFTHRDNIFFIAQPLNDSFKEYFSFICLVNYLAFLCTVFGFKCFSKLKVSSKQLRPVNFDYSFLFFFLILLGGANFLYNQFILCSLSLSQLSAIYLNVDKIEQNSTTLFYNFIYLSLYLYLIRYKINKKNLVVLLLLSLLISFSTLRLFFTITILMTAIGYLYEKNNSPKKNCQILLIFLGITILAVCLYTIRVFFTYKLQGLPFPYKDFFKQFGYYAFNKGNTPNIAIQIELLEKWDSRLYGKTFLAPVMYFFRKVIDFSLYIPASIVKKMYFMNVPSGNLPVTGMGEFFMNFGYPGIFIGMFFFGGVMHLLYKFFYKTEDNVKKLLGCYYSFSFFMLFSKGEINNFDFFILIEFVFLFGLIRFVSFGSKKIYGV